MNTNLTKLDTHGGRLFYEIPRNDQDTPDYYFTTKSHTNFHHPYVSLRGSIVDIRSGIVVLDAEWILDSLDVQTFLPDKHYIVEGLPTSRMSWSMFPSYHAEIDPMKWFTDGLWGTSTPKRTKRVFEMEVELQSRKKRVSVAINDVEAALSRLREVTGTDPTNHSPQNLKYETHPPEVTELSDTSAAGNAIVRKPDLNALERDLVETGEEGDSFDEGEYMTAQESDSVKVEEEEDLEKLLNAVEYAHSERPTSSVKSESPESSKVYKPLESSESEEFDDGWTSNDTLTDELDSDEMDEIYEDSDMEVATCEDEQSQFDVAWDSPNTSDKDESDEEEWKDYKSLVSARTSFESSVNRGNGDCHEGFKKAAVILRTIEKESVSNEWEKYGMGKKKAQVTESVDSRFSLRRSCQEIGRRGYYGTPEIEVEIANPEKSHHQTDINTLPSTLNRAPGTEDAPAPTIPCSQDSHQRWMSLVRQTPDPVTDISDEYTSSTKSFQYPPTLGSTWLKRTNSQSHQSPQYGSPSADSFSNGEVESRCRSPSSLPCISTEQQSPLTIYSPPKEPEDSPQLSGKGIRSQVNNFSDDDRYDTPPPAPEEPISVFYNRLFKQPQKSHQTPPKGTPSPVNIFSVEDSSPWVTPPCVTPQQRTSVSEYHSLKQPEKSRQTPPKGIPLQVDSFPIEDSSPSISPPCVTPLQERVSFSTYPFLKPTQKFPQPFPKENPSKQPPLDSDLTEYHITTPQVTPPRHTGFTPINEKPPVNFPLLTFPSPLPDRPLFAAERFSEFITPRSPARQARLESASKLQKSVFPGYSRDELSVSSEDIYLPNLKSSSPELTMHDPLRISVGSSVGSNVDSGGGVEVWEAKCLEMGEKMIRFMRVGKSIREGGGSGAGEILL